MAIASCWQSAISNKSKAFDNTFTYRWESKTTGAAVVGAVYIGYNFPAAQVVTHARLWQYTYGETESSVIIQGSNDLQSWSNIATVDLVFGANDFTFANGTSYAAIRFLANSPLPEGSEWDVYEIEMLTQ
jgi:hypothetical protein